MGVQEMQEMNRFMGVQEIAPRKSIYGCPGNRFMGVQEIDQEIAGNHEEIAKAVQNLEHCAVTAYMQPFSK